MPFFFLRAYPAVPLFFFSLTLGIWNNSEIYKARKFEITKRDFESARKKIFYQYCNFFWLRVHCCELITLAHRRRLRGVHDADLRLITKYNLKSDVKAW